MNRFHEVEMSIFSKRQEQLSPYDCFISLQCWFQKHPCVRDYELGSTSRVTLPACNSCF
uniref:Uncharacterized protein n=1 Tax=Octopus bimaculoides TaxID=37653 RepID=A0A0L8HPD7_OCTBM